MHLSSNERCKSIKESEWATDQSQQWKQEKDLKLVRCVGCKEQKF